MSGVKQDIEGTIREFEQVEGRVGLVPVELRSDIDNDVPQRLLGWNAFGPAELGQTA